MRPRGIAGTTACGPGQNCGRIIVRPSVLQEGKPVKSSTLLDVNLANGRSVARPDIVPTRAGMLPGAPVAQAASFAPRTNLGRAEQNGNSTQVSSGRNAVVVGGESSGAQRAPASQSGVVYDSASGRFVNSNAIRPVPATERSGEAAPGNEEHSASPILNRSAAPDRGSPSGQIETAAPTREAPSFGHESAAPAARPSHSEAPVYRPSSSYSSGSRNGGSSRSTSYGESRSSSYGGGHSSGGSWGMGGSSGGGSHSSGASSGGGGHSSG